MDKEDFLGIYVAIAIFTFFWIQNPEEHMADTMVRAVLWPVTGINYVINNVDM